jgi:hypothetical protein
MNVQEFEERSYFTATEHQNSFAMSCMTRKPDDSARIDQLVQSGKHVVVHVGTDYCQHTDAVIGSRFILVSVHDTRELADAALRGEGGHDPDESFIVFSKRNDLVLESDSLPF